MCFRKCQNFSKRKNQIVLASIFFDIDFEIACVALGNGLSRPFFCWHFYLLCIILLQVSPHRLNHLHFVNMFVEHDHVFSKFNWVGREIGEAKECFLEKMESMDLTMLTCLHTPPRFVLKRLEDPRIKNLKIDADLLEA